MAAAAPPLIEAVVARVLLALGLGAAGGEVTREVVKARNEEADKAKTTPIAKAESQTKEKERCKECAPDKGAFFNRPTAGWSEISIAYQFRICGLPVGPGFITEWMYNAVTFDGFDPSQCLLKEAKARYDQFFDDFGHRLDFWQGDEALIKQAVAQSLVAEPQPPVQVRWYFMEPMSYRYFSKIFSTAKLRIETVFQP